MSQAAMTLSHVMNGEGRASDLPLDLAPTLTRCTRQTEWMIGFISLNDRVTLVKCHWSLGWPLVVAVATISAHVHPSHS
eukprot:1628532-Amphidinium_carterae.1